MTTIKTPTTDLIIKINDIHNEYEYHFSAPHGNFSIYEIAKYIESGFDAKILTTKLVKSDDCIDKQTIKDVKSKSKELEKWIDENPSEFKRIVDEVDAMGFEGPTVDEYFNSLGGGFTAQEMIDFAQHLLKDYSTIEVTQETLNKFLNKK